MLKYQLPIVAMRNKVLFCKSLSLKLASAMYVQERQPNFHAYLCCKIIIFIRVLGHLIILAITVKR